MFTKAMIIPTGDELAAGIVLDTDAPEIMKNLLAIPIFLLYSGSRLLKSWGKSGKEAGTESRISAKTDGWEHIWQNI